jgi:hypothetical protein
VVRAANISGVIPPEEQAQSMRLLNYYLQRPNREEDAGSMFWTRDTVLQFIRDQALQFYSVASQTLNNSASNPPRRGTVVQPLDHEGAQKNPHHFSPVWLEALVKNAVNPDIPDVVKFKPYIPFDSKDVELGSRLGKGFFGVGMH